MSQNTDTSQSQRIRYLKDRVNYAGYVVNQALVAEGQSQFPLPIEAGTAALTPHECVLGDLKAGAIYTSCAEYNALILSTYKLPGAPTGVTASVSTTDNAADVSWISPAFTGYTPILRYIITSNPPTTPITVSGLTHSVVYTGLTPTVSYTFTVVAVNIIGAGPPSAPSGPVIPPIPLALTFFLVASGGGGGTGGGGGGGGAGGVFSGPLSIPRNFNIYNINVGAPLTSGTKQDAQDGYPGGNTTFTGTGITLTAIGGGAGQGWTVDPARTTGTATGGSGGGGGGGANGLTLPGGAGTAGQGYAGGVSDGGGYEGGGGGAGGVGGSGNGVICGSGGVGTSAYSDLLSTVTGLGIPVGVNSGGTYYIGGGGAGARSVAGLPTDYGQGGLGGGGGGLNFNGGISGTVNTGGGGGAEGVSYSNGGTGLGIIYYTNATQLATGGTVVSSGTGPTTVWYHVYLTSDIFLY